MEMDQLVYGTKDNETYLTMYFSRVELDEIDKLEQRAAVYKIFNHDNELMYIGETKRLAGRMKDHLKPNYGKKEINRKTVSHYLYAYVNADKNERGIIEKILIDKYKPTLNCDDEMITDAKTTLDDATMRDMLFYVRNSDIKDSVIAKALNTPLHNITAINHLGTYNSIKLPKNYVPTTLITDEMVKRYSERYVSTYEDFVKVRELLEEGKKPSEIELETRVSYVTIMNMKNLKSRKFKKWEEERLATV